ncbi:MAG: rhomboid family intramembrane serine protease [Rhizobiaceae bacterium]|nr:rhomboid family intramembrane serine protease [Rhizobiaceae bacterium]
MFIPLHDKNSLVNIRLQYVTLALIAINVVVWLMSAAIASGNETALGSVFISYGYIPAVASDLRDIPPDLAVIPFEASYITYSFMHANFMHLAGNMLFLWVFGDNIEDAMGHFRYLIFYLLCAAIAAYVHGTISPTSEAPLVGASGATSGVVGAYLMLHPKVKVWVLVLGRIPLRLSAFWVLGAWILFQIYSLIAFYDSDVSWAAHVGGFFAGALLVLIMKRSDVPLFDQNLASAVAKADDEQVSQPRTQDNPRRWGRGS